MTLMTGIYIFTSQIIIVRLLPIAHGGDQDFFLMFGHTKTEIENLCQNSNTPFFDVGDVVKGSMSISSPLLTIIGTSPFFLAGGAGVLFTQSLGKDSKAKAREVYKTSFWMIALYTIALISILCALNRPILNAMSAKPTTCSDDTLNEYYQKVTSEQVVLASDYTLVMTGGLFLTMFTILFASLIKSEGRFKLVAITGIMCNILSIGLVVIFIYIAKIGIAGGALGNVVSFTVYLGVLLIYLIILNKRQDT
ncbi:hypothetical protein FACS1894218_5900 [Bacilli bacterium]|nr:hypothetical protein FACS1894218_5900 [Bacilli bacterium]